MPQIVNPPSAAARRVGRPRSEAARRAILAAANDLLDAGGLSAVTVEAVAARARVGKPTIYRHWPNATALAMAALIDAPAAAPDAPPDPAAGASPLADLRRQLLRVTAAFARPRGRQVAQILAAADVESEISKTFRNAVILGSRAKGRLLIERAVAAGEIIAPAVIDVALDMIYGPLFYRLLVGHAPLDATFAAALIDQLLSGLAPAPASR